MIAPRRFALLLLLALTLLAAGCGDDEGGDQDAAPPATVAEDGEAPGGELALEVMQFDDGEAIPVANTCDGEGGGTAPLLEISGAPDGTAELAVLVTDPDAPGGEFFHWGVWGISPDIASFGPLGPPAGGREAETDGGEVGYTPPCPPPGDEPHRYLFTVHAVEEKIDLAEGASPAEVSAAVEAASIDSATVTGTYGR